MLNVEEENSCVQQLWVSRNGTGCVQSIIKCLSRLNTTTTAVLVLNFFVMQYEQHTSFKFHATHQTKRSHPVQELCITTSVHDQLLIIA